MDSIGLLTTTTEVAGTTQTNAEIRTFSAATKTGTLTTSPSVISEWNIEREIYGIHVFLYAAGNNGERSFYIPAKPIVTAITSASYVSIESARYQIYIDSVLTDVAIVYLYCKRDGVAIYASTYSQYISSNYEIHGIFSAMLFH